MTGTYTMIKVAKKPAKQHDKRNTVPNYAVKKTIYIGKQCGMQLDEIGGINMEERNLVAVSIKHTIYGWKF